MSSNKYIKLEELAKHNKESDCWCMIHGKVYDLSSFLHQHPGGKAIIMEYAGKDATQAFDKVHPKDIIHKLLGPDVELGAIEGYRSDEQSPIKPVNKETIIYQDKRKILPALENIVNLEDFEHLAPLVLSNEAWAYYSSGSDDEITMKENVLAFKRIFLRPRVMVGVENIDFRCKILGQDSSFPVYITATALGKLGHPDGEIVLTRAASAKKIVQMLPTLSSCSLEDMLSARTENQVQFFQLYANSNKKVMKKLIKTAEDGGCKALFITVDAPSLGKRELDIRTKSHNLSIIQKKDKGDKKVEKQGTARAISGFIDPGLNWEDIKWFSKSTNMKIVLKGIQCLEDAIKALEYKVDGIVISNHGGRQIDTGLSGIEMLVDIMPSLEKHMSENHIPKDSFEVYLDGGIRRGSDIFKAYALGAKAVGIGRPLLFAMSTYGQDGVETALDILMEELALTMRIMGTPKLSDIKREMIDLSNLKFRTSSQILKSIQNPRSVSILDLVKNKL